MRTTPFQILTRRTGAALLATGLAVLAACAGGSSGAPMPAPSPAPVPDQPRGEATGSYAFWPVFPEPQRVQYVRAINSTEDITAKKASGLEKLVFGKEVEPATLIDKPYGVAMRKGRIYVCDFHGASLTVLDLRQKQTRLVGVSGGNTLKHPVAVAIADDGEIFVADTELGAVMVFDAAERYSRVFGHSKLKPGGVAVYGDKVYVTDMTSQLLEVYDRRSGERVQTIGSIGDEDGQFRLPLGVATDAKGNVYVSDMMRCRVQKFGPDGKFISGIGEMGDSGGKFARPKHIAVDSDGVLYVVDAAFQNVQMFDEQGRLLLHFGSAGGHAGAMDLPAGICVSEDSIDTIADDLHPGFKAKRAVVVTNQFGENKVAVYAVGGVREGFTPRDLAARAAKVDSGVDAAPSPERLKLQNPGTKEPVIDPDTVPKSTPKGTPTPPAAPAAPAPAAPAPPAPAAPAPAPATNP